MGRRRKKNPILTRILVVSLAAHAIALPIAAHYGAFEKVKQEFGSSKLVVINTPPLKETKAPEKAKKKEQKQKTNETKKGPSAPHKSASASKQDSNQQKVLNGPADASGTGVDANPNAGGGKLGEIPKAGGTTTPQPPGPPHDAGPTTPQPTNPEPPSKPPTPPPQPQPPTPQPPKAKKFVQVETTYAPEPAIPDDLRSESFEKTLVVEADVDKSGEPTNIKVAQSTGTRELDDVGLDTAKKYRFKPATMDDSPVEGHVRFRIIFKVE